MQVNVATNEFRPIYYLGCKANFTDAIKAAIDEVDPAQGHVCDLFAGTGVVAAALSPFRDVTTVDIQEYSRVLCSAMLDPPALTTPQIIKLAASLGSSELAKNLASCLQPLIEHEFRCMTLAADGDAVPLVELLEALPVGVFDERAELAQSVELSGAMRESVARLRAAGLWDSPDSTMSRLFGGVYFSYRQSAALDVILANAEAADEPLRNSLKAAALSTASQLVNTVGKQFAQPLRPRHKSGEIKGNLAKIVLRDRGWDAFEVYRKWLARYASLSRPAGRVRALRRDYLEVLQEPNQEFSVLYADPPYTRDHYSRFYHVLETMCLRDNPSVSRVVKNGATLVSRGLYREDRHQSPFCIRSTAPAAFEALFKAARQRDVPLVLSYSPHEADDGTHPRVVSMSLVVELARAQFKRVDATAIEGSVHNNLNREGLKLKAREHAEILLKCFR